MATTRYKTVKDLKDVTLVGVAVDIEKVDGSISTVTIRDLAGKNGKPPAELVIRVKDYSVAVLVPAPEPTVKRFQLAFDLKGIAVRELFDVREMAVARWRDLTEQDTLPPDGAVTAVEVPEGEPISDKADDLPLF